MTPQRVAIVHERFTGWAGSERVAEQLHLLYPQASVHAAVVDPDVLPPSLREAGVHPSECQRLYRGGPSYAYLLPLLPLAMRRLDLGDADLVITSHHAFANRVRARAGVPIVSYTHTPARWIWEPAMRENEVGGRLGGIGLAVFAATQRHADVDAARRLTRVVANSRHVAARVRRWWGRSATVIPPPVAVERFTPGPPAEREDFFLLAGRLVPYKRPEVAAAAARRAGIRLVVAGDGRARRAVAEAGGSTVEMLGEVDDDTMVDLMRRCRAVVFPGEEDFGIVPVEAQACGTPVLALDLGGVRDSVLPGVTGTLYTPGGAGGEVEALAIVMRSFDPTAFDPVTIRTHAETFAPGVFRDRFAAVIGEVMAVA